MSRMKDIQNVWPGMTLRGAIAFRLRAPQLACAGATLALLMVFGPACGRQEAASEAELRDYRPVLAHTRQRQAAAQSAWQIEQAIGTFQRQMGRYPSNLVEIVKAGFIERIPEPPPGMGYLYDPGSGIFRIAPLPESQQPSPPR